MTLSDFSIRKPVFAWMLMLGLIVFGIICFTDMGVSQLPDVDFPVLNVAVTWTGASPETMESSVTDVIENAVMSVEGIRNVSSTCQEGVSNTSIEFDLSINIDVALQEVQTKLSQAQKTLPTDIDPPIVTKSNPEDQPIVWTSLYGPNSLRDKILFARDQLKDRLTTINGVGDVNMGGYVDPNMRIWVNTDAMRKREISVDDVVNAISSGTILTPSGYMDNGPGETNLRVMSEARTSQQFANLLIPSRAGSAIWSSIKIGDVAKIEEGLADVRKTARINGEPSISLGIIKRRGSNAVSVGQAIQLKVAELSKTLPQGMLMKIIVDTTRFIKASVNELLFTLSLAAILTSLVCYLFLGSWGSAFNVILAIPTSLIGSFIIMKFLGFTINTFTLLALSLSIGIVVDDAIMVLENIVRHFEKGMSRIEASIIGAREITGAATAASLAILAIFLPVIFMKGIIGKFFFQFGVAISIAVVLSLVEALTLAPMRCSQFLSTGKETFIGRGMNRFMDWLTKKYEQSLVYSLNHRWKIITVSLAIFASSLLLIRGARQEFVPAQDQNLFIATVYCPMGSSLEFTDSVFIEAQKQMRARPEVDNVLTIVGGFGGGLVNQGNMLVVLKDPSKRGVQAPFDHKPSQQEFMGWAREAIGKIKGVQRATLLDPSQGGFTAKRSLPITFSVQGPDWDKLADYSQKMMDSMKQSGLMTDVDSSYNPNMPEVKIYPDREKAAGRGVTISNIANTISALAGSLRVGKYTDESGHRDDVRLKLQDQDNKTPNDLAKLSVRNIHGEMIPLTDLIKMENKPSLLTITRYERERAITIYANLLPGKSQSVAMDYIDKAAVQILPPGYHTVLSGSSEAFQESFKSLGVALILGIFVAYMVLGAQFNSFVHPVTVLMALPFSVTGAFIALRITDISLNIYSMIGLLLLMGIVKKNSILLVEFTNQIREHGEKDVKAALIKACPMRLRPILMTSVATVAAAIPSAIAFGPGAETTRPMSVVVIGGVIMSTLLTLIVVPCAYSLMSRLESKKRHDELAEAIHHLDGIEAKAYAQAHHT